MAIKIAGSALKCRVGWASGNTANFRTYIKNSRVNNIVAASPGMLRAVSRIRTVIRLAPVTDGIASVDTVVKILKRKLQYCSS